MTHTTTPLICSECGMGNYFRIAPNTWVCVAARSPLPWQGAACGKTITRGDIELDEGESLSHDAGGLLSVVTPD